MLERQKSWKKIGLPSIGEGANDNLGDIPTRIVSGILDRGTLEHGVSAEGNADPLKYQSQSLMRYNIMFTQSLTMTVPSNTNLKAGNIIECCFQKQQRKQRQMNLTRTKAVHI